MPFETSRSLRPVTTLRDNGTITEDEYKAVRQRLLSA
jgi:hypothetical protein